jgi:hypothetical protein
LRIFFHPSRIASDEHKWWVGLFPVSCQTIISAEIMERKNKEFVQSAVVFEKILENR